jgi:ribosomal protein S18 acetylase RimI-like enzyme
MRGHWRRLGLQMIPHSFDITCLPPSRYDEAAGLLAMSFENDPLLPYLTFEKGDVHRSFVHRIVRMEVDFHATGENDLLAVVYNGELVAVALIERPDASVAYVRVARAAIQLLFQTNSSVVLRTWRYFMTISANRPRTPHFYLEAVAVHPKTRGRGLGRLLLDELHAKSAADSSSQGIALVTANPANVGFYERFGYRLVQPRVTLRDLELYYFFRPDV